ncbi:uncharacterized protein LOC132502511 [Mesoplodon densirostris]|uniref:uncharacterized protein LOC132502511 n=1 Tax=Mesoplodon densirostris TaxID=48708 RepID=UPI0028DBD1D4|nr:uncharacterized protein LOC132502511 [Mesoplodon densirostris]
MDGKCGKYVVNMEHSGNQPMSIGGTTVPFPNLGNDEAQSSACKFATSVDVTGDAGPNLTDICTNRGTLGLSKFPNRESQHCQVTGNLFSGWSLWKIFLACLLASVITTAIGVLIVSLVHNGKNNNASIVIQLTQNQGIISLPETSSPDYSKTTVATSTIDGNTTSTSSTMTTITEHPSAEPTGTPTTDSTETTIATTTTSTEKTTPNITDTTSEGTNKTATTASTTSTETMTTVATTTPQPTTTTTAGTTTEGTTTTDTTASTTSTESMTTTVATTSAEPASTTTISTIEDVTFTIFQLYIASFHQDETCSATFQSLDDQEVQSSACQFPPSVDVNGEVCTNVTAACISPERQFQYGEQRNLQPPQQTTPPLMATEPVAIKPTTTTSLEPATSTVSAEPTDTNCHNLHFS